MTVILRLSAAAKVNLSLHITGRRSDGYHYLDSLIGFTNVCDLLTVSRSDDITLKVTGPNGSAIEADDRNLVVRAAKLVQKHFGISSGAAFTLEKNTPVAAGMGGGSADAAAAVTACLALWGTPDSKPITDQILADELGADVPVCRYGRAAHISGIGETITPALNWPDAWLVLVNPNITLSTKEVFSAFDGEFDLACDRTFKGRSFDEFVGFLFAQQNSLTTPACLIAPQIKSVLEALEKVSGCALARMSGSGPTCFGLFETQDLAETAAGELGRHQTEWWVKSTPLRVTTQALEAPHL